MRSLKKLFKKDQRKSPRYPLPLLVFTDEGVERSERLNHISSGGCSITTPVFYDVGDHVLLHFEPTPHLQEQIRDFCMDGCVVRRSNEADNRYTYGLQFGGYTGTFFRTERRVLEETIRSNTP